jgi:hypothetical protein
MPATDQLSSDANLMSDFVLRYGETPAATEDPREAIKPADVPPEVDDDGEPELALDDATLEALGLKTAKKEPSQKGESADDDAEESNQIDLEALAKTLGLSVDDLSLDGATGVKLKTKVDGEHAEVSLEELRKGYQLQKHFTKQQEQFLAERQQWEQVRAQQEQQFQAQAMLAGEVLQSEEAQLKAAYTRDWAALRQEDPAEYAAQVAEYNQKLSGLKERQAQLVDRIQQTVQARQQESQQATLQVMQAEQTRLADSLGWKDPETTQKGAKQLQDYLLNTVGLTPQHLASIVDHRAFVLADKARRYDELMGKVNLARKKVEPTTKVPTGTAAPIQPAQTGRKSVQQAMSRLHSDHSIESAAEVFKRLKVV